MTLTIQKAHKGEAKLRMALIGISGSGKTFTSLKISKALGERVLLLDTEHGSASKYAEFDFDTVTLENYHPKNYIEVIQLAEANRYDVFIIDSLSHAWSGKGGALELVDNITKRNQTNNSFAAWRDVTPLHNQLIDAILGARLHVIATLRAKTEYVQEKDERGRTVIRKVGLAPIQRSELEYEFDVVADLDQDNNLIIGKTRCPQLAGALFPKAGADVAAIIREWLSDGNEGEGSAPAVQPVVEPAVHAAVELATPERLVDYEMFRLSAISKGYRTPSGNEPKPLYPGTPAAEVEKRLAVLGEWIVAFDREHEDETSNGTPPPPHEQPHEQPYQQPLANSDTRKEATEYLAKQFTHTPVEELGDDPYDESNPALFPIDETVTTPAPAQSGGSGGYGKD